MEKKKNLNISVPLKNNVRKSVPIIGMTKLVSLIGIVLIFTLFLPIGLAQTPEKYCGDGFCDLGEDEINCEVDCRCAAEVITIEQEITTSRTQERTLPVDFFIRETNLEETCGYDGNLDGFACDPNEDWTNCPSDCSTPSLDALLCVGPDCLWREAWFVRLILLGLGIGGAFIILRGRMKR